MREQRKKSTEFDADQNRYRICCNLLEGRGILAGANLAYRFDNRLDQHVCGEGLT